MFGLINRYRNNKIWENEAQRRYHGMSKSERMRWRDLTETPIKNCGGVWGFVGNENCGSLVYKAEDGNFYLLAVRADFPRINSNITKWRYSNY